MQKAAHAYLQTQVTTTGQGDVVVLLYDGAIKFLNQAKERLDANDMAAKGINISKTLDIINELDGSLNLEKGGDLARNLHGLYIFCQNHLIKANINKSAAMIDDVIKILAGLRSAYAEILTMPEAQAAAKEAADNLGAKAITVAKSQPGISPTVNAAPQPGAGARMRASYAKASAGFALPNGTDEQQAAPESVSGEMSAPGAAPKAFAKAESAKDGEKDEPKPEAASAYPILGGFGQRLGGADMFKKYAAMGQK